MDLDSPLIKIIRVGRLYDFILEVSKGHYIGPEVLRLTMLYKQFRMAEYLLNIGIPFPNTMDHIFSEFVKDNDIQFIQLCIDHGMQIYEHHLTLIIYRNRINILKMFTNYIRNNYTDITSLIQTSNDYERPEIYNWLISLNIPYN